MKQLLGLIFLSSVMMGCQQNATTKQNTVASEYNARLGIAYLKRGQIKRAKIKLISSIEQDPRSADAHLAMAYFWEKQKEVKLAEQEYKLAERYKPSSGRVHNNYGVFLCKLGQYAKADRHFQIAAKDTAYEKSAEMYENAGLCALKNAQKSQAHFYFEKAISQDPTRYQSLMELATIELERRNPKRVYELIATYHKYFNPTPHSLWLAHISAARIGLSKKSNQYASQLKKDFPRHRLTKQLIGVA